MPTTLYLMRHGATVGNEEKRYKGSIDIPMSEYGVEQIKRATEFIQATLHGSLLSAVYTSPLSRALKSAEILAEPFWPDACDHAGLKRAPFRQMGRHDFQ